MREVDSSPLEEEKDKDDQLENPVFPSEIFKHMLIFMGLSQSLTFSLVSHQLRKLTKEHLFTKLNRLYDEEMKYLRLRKELGSNLRPIFNSHLDIAPNIPPIFIDGYEKAYSILNYFTDGLLDKKSQKNELNFYQDLFIQCVIAIIEQENELLARILEPLAALSRGYQGFGTKGDTAPHNNTGYQLFYLSCRVGNLSAFEKLMFHPIREATVVHFEYFRDDMKSVMWCPLFNSKNLSSFEKIVREVFPTSERKLGYTDLRDFLGLETLYKLLAFMDIDFIELHLFCPPRATPKEYYKFYLPAIGQAWRNPNATKIVPFLVEKIQKNQAPFNVWNPFKNISGYKNRFTSENLDISDLLLDYIGKHLERNFENFCLLVQAAKDHNCEENTFIIFFTWMAKNENVRNQNRLLAMLLDPQDPTLCKEVALLFWDANIRYHSPSSSDVLRLLQKEELSKDELIAVAKASLDSPHWLNIMRVLLSYAEQQGLAFTINDVIASIFEKSIQMDEEKFRWLHARGIDFHKPIMGQPGHLWMREYINIQKDYFAVTKILTEIYGLPLDFCDHDGKNILHIILAKELDALGREQFQLTISLIPAPMLQSLVKQPDKDGNTPLHYLCANKETHSQSEVAGVLVQNGANIHAKNNQGQRPIDVIAAYPLVDGESPFEFSFASYSMLLKKVELLPIFEIALFDPKYGCGNEILLYVNSKDSISALFELIDINQLFDNPKELDALRKLLHDELMMINKKVAIFSDEKNMFLQLLPIFQAEKSAADLFQDPNVATTAQNSAMKLLNESPLFLYLIMFFSSSRDSFAEDEFSKTVFLESSRHKFNEYRQLAVHVFSKLSTTNEFDLLASPNRN